MNWDDQVLPPKRIMHENTWRVAGKTNHSIWTPGRSKGTSECMLYIFHRMLLYIFHRIKKYIFKSNSYKYPHFFFAEERAKRWLLLLLLQCPITRVLLNCNRENSGHQAGFADSKGCVHILTGWTEIEIFLQAQQPHICVLMVYFFSFWHSALHVWTALMKCSIDYKAVCLSVKIRIQFSQPLWEILDSYDNGSKSLEVSG